MTGLAAVIAELERTWPENRAVNLVFHGHSVPSGYFATPVIDRRASYPHVVAGRLAETLRSWLLHQGRRDDVAGHLHVHPQTVRYRMTQIRELFGDRLRDPAAVRDLVVALGATGPRP